MAVFEISSARFEESTGVSPVGTQGDVVPQRKRKVTSSPACAAISEEPDIVLSAYHRRQALFLASHSSISAIIMGETGTGKEEFVKFVHRLRSSESEVPLVTVNCASLNSDIAESTLFGHVKGAFSGADRQTVGAVAQADGGILFLDEIHCLSLETQRRLLRVLNDGSFCRVGSSVENRVLFQAIAATTRDLDDAVEAGEFLLDLRTRLLGLEVTLLPLRERVADIPCFIELFFRRQGITLSPAVLNDLTQQCQRYYWQGNIRQLFKALQVLSMTAAFEGKEIRAGDLPEFRTMLRPRQVTVPDIREQASERPKVLAGSRPACMELLECALTEDVPLKSVMSEIEKTIIEAALNRHRSIQGAFIGLRIGRNTMDAKRRKYKLV